MKIAVPYENGQVFQHFGHTGQFKIYDVEDGQIAGERTVEPTGGGHGALAGFLTGLWVDTLICGGIGAGAQEALAQAVRALLAGTLQYSTEVRCSHHEHHGEHGHCGEDKHGCAGSGGHCGG